MQLRLEFLLVRFCRGTCRQRIKSERARAEFERSMIRERVHASLKRAVANGKVLRRRPIETDPDRMIVESLTPRPGIREHNRTEGRRVGSHHPQGDAAMAKPNGSCEGIVSKHRGSPYRPGRSDHWLKIKNPAAPAVRRLEEEDWL